MRIPFQTSPSTPSRLTLFALLYAWANLLHQLSYPEWIKGLQLIGWLLFFASGFLALRPSSYPLLVATLILRIAYTASWMPMIRGHLFIEGLFSLGILLALILKSKELRQYSRYTHEQQETLFASFAPFLRVTGLIVYAAVTVSKLNSEFILAEKSAAVQLHLWTAAKHPWVPTGAWAQQISIWGTLLFEGGIPLLLLFRKTRWVGLILALFFHSLLGVLPLRVCSFTLMMCLLLYVWLPSENPRKIHASFLRFSETIKLQPFQVMVLFYAIAGLTGILYSGRNGFNLEMSTLDVGMGMWLWQTLVMLAALWVVRDLPREKSKSMLRIRSWPLVLYASFVFFNCLCPYIGLKTRSALSMHCNLRTEEGYWNHLFLPESMRVFNFQNELVTIMDSDLPDFAHLQKAGMPLPYFEFRRWCRLAAQDFRVTYRDPSGTIRHFSKTSGKPSDPTLVEASPMLEWFLCFNPVGAAHDYMPSLTKRVGPARNIVPHFDSKAAQ